MSVYTVSPEVAAAIEECKKMYPNAILFIDGHPASIVGICATKDKEHAPKMWSVADGPGIALTPEQLDIAAPDTSHADALIANLAIDLETERRKSAALMQDLGEAGNAILGLEKELEEVREQIQRNSLLIVLLRNDVKVARMQRDHSDRTLAGIHAKLKDVNELTKKLDGKIHTAWCHSAPPSRAADKVR